MTSSGPLVWGTLGLKVCIPVEFLELSRLTNLSQTAIPRVKAHKVSEGIRGGLLHSTDSRCRKLESKYYTHSSLASYCYVHTYVRLDPNVVWGIKLSCFMRLGLKEVTIYLYKKQHPKKQRRC